ncbi:hypothetical protein GQ44DRAFT_732201 [Phaeosphaeriaceae sp. PMI808]|nr:hypothetical protein GQ44DRAFT_732201 [Phaeosphaeriaceae sp. PMI808]
MAYARAKVTAVAGNANGAVHLAERVPQSRDQTLWAKGQTPTASVLLDTGRVYIYIHRRGNDFLWAKLTSILYEKPIRRNMNFVISPNYLPSVISMLGFTAVKASRTGTYNAHSSWKWDIVSILTLIDEEYANVHKTHSHAARKAHAGYTYSPTQVA